MARHRVRVRYVDKLTRSEILDLYPEIPDPDAVGNVDYICDLNRPMDLVALFGRDALDFVIASHILEHIPNPILALEALDAVLRPSGKALIAVPDNHSRIDKGRVPTELSSVIEAYESEKLHVGPDDAASYLAEIGAETTPENIATVLARSFHIYSWTFASFHRLLASVVARGTVRWLLRDFSRGDGDEHIFLFEKMLLDLDYEAELAVALRRGSASPDFP